MKHQRMSQIWMEQQPFIQSPSQKLKFSNNRQKIRKCRYQSFLVLCNFNGCFYFVTRILSGISLQNQIFWIFLYFWSLTKILHKFSCIKIPNLIVLSQYKSLCCFRSKPDFELGSIVFICRTTFFEPNVQESQKKTKN